MSKFVASDTLELPIAERINLVADIWDTIAAAPDALSVTEEERKLINERLAAMEANPEASSSLDEVIARIRARKR